VADQTNPKDPTGFNPDNTALNALTIRDRYTSGLKPIRSELQNYWLNHSFILGHQWLWFNPSSRTLSELPRDPDRVQATINRMWPNSRIIISKAVQRELTFEVIPSAADDEAMEGAKLGESILDDHRKRHQWESLREKLSWMAWKGGTAAIGVDWDPNAGDVIAASEGTKINQGDTVETPLSLAEFVVEPGVRDGERARWWVKSQVLPPENVQAMFGLSKLPDADASNGMSPFQRKMLTSQYSGSTSDQLVDLTLVLTYYERPNALRPEGAIAVVVGEEVVAGGVRPWPFPFKEHLNLAIVHETPNETKWSGETVCTMARPIQTALNASWSSIIEHMKNAGNARLILPQSAVDLMDSLTDMPGEIVPYPDGTEKPGWLSPAQMPAWWIEEPKALRDEIDDVMGVHDVSRGQAPTNIDSGYGLSVLAEQDTTPVGKLVKSTAQAFGRVATMVLQTMEVQVKDQRKAVVRTPSAPPQTTSWTGSDLAGQTMAEVPLESVMPRNHSAMAQLGKELVQMGLIQTFEQFATVSEMPGYKDLINRLDPDVSKARWENHAMAEGNPEIPEKFDDHHIHIHELNNFRKTPRYRALDPDTRQIFEDHAKAHEVLAAEAAGRMQAMSAADPNMAEAVPDSDGTPPPAPLPPPDVRPARVGAGMMLGGAPRKLFSGKPGQ
jgi:hypothetical protein